MSLSGIPRAEWIAMAAVIIALTAAYYTARNFHLSARREQREIAARDPIVEYESWPAADGTEPWFCYRITVRNRFDHALHIDEMKLVGPAKAEIAEVKIAIVNNGDGTYHHRADIHPLPDRKFPVGYARIDRAGGMDFDVYLKPLSRAAEFSICLNLSDRRASSRRFAMTVKIKVPADTASAKIDNHSLG